MSKLTAPPADVRQEGGAADYAAFIFDRVRHELLLRQPCVLANIAKGGRGRNLG